jgi:hypothetical protein
MSKSFEPRFLCSKIHSSPPSCIPKFCVIIWEFFYKYFYHQNPFIQFYFNPENQLKLIFFYSFGFQPEQGIRPDLLPPFPAHTAQQATSALAPSKFTSLASENVQNQKPPSPSSSPSSCTHRRLATERQRAPPCPPATSSARDRTSLGLLLLPPPSIGAASTSPPSVTGHHLKTHHHRHHYRSATSPPPRPYKRDPSPRNTPRQPSPTPSPLLRGPIPTLTSSGHRHHPSPSCRLLITHRC